MCAEARKHYGDRVSTLSCPGIRVTDGSMVQHKTQSSLRQDGVHEHLMDYRGGSGSQ